MHECRPASYIYHEYPALHSAQTGNTLVRTMRHPNQALHLQCMHFLDARSVLSRKICYATSRVAQ